MLRVQLLRDGDSSVQRRPLITGPQDAAAIFSEYLSNQDREHLAILLLDVRNRVIGIHTVAIGTLDAALVSPREVYKAAILANARSIILAHNHPSGDPTPSPEDERITKKLVAAGELLDIQLVDHLVVGERGNFRSLKALGKM